jgi:hypothetical protein
MTAYALTDILLIVACLWLGGKIQRLQKDVKTLQDERLKLVRYLDNWRIESTRGNLNKPSRGK